jgi:beta-glucosidase
MGFPKNFVWGAATAAYQIEGAAFEDGKGWSVWDMFTRKKNAIKRKQKGDIACDHYHRYKEDVALMKEIGLRAYRLSLSWPRIIPDGFGKINPKGLDFYNKLVDELLANDIVPYITLFHWDYPYELYKKGGWLNPDSPKWFADYTKTAIETLSDRVTNWITFNEPQMFIGLGHDKGAHAPGLRLGTKDIAQICHNVLLSHGHSVRAIRQYAKQPCTVGFAPAGMVPIPNTKSAEDIEAARKGMFYVGNDTIAGSHAWWCDPVFLGSYPEIDLGESMPDIKQDDMKIISQPIDFLGINIYQGYKVYDNEEGNNVVVPFEDGNPTTAFGWAVVPEVLHWGPKFLFERYNIPIIITENGMAGTDWVAVDNKVHDPQRIDFIARYLKNLHKAMDEGATVLGYFCWSLMDNFEWAAGFDPRFGLIYVDYQTQKRTIKDSGYWYREVIESNGNSINI